VPSSLAGNWRGSNLYWKQLPWHISRTHIYCCRLGEQKITVAGFSDQKECFGKSQTKSQWQHSEGNVAGVKLYAKKYVAMALKRRKK